MQQVAIPAQVRSALSEHLSRKGLPPSSCVGLLDAVEQGCAAGEADAVSLRDRLVSSATADLEARIALVADEIADLVISPVETLGDGT